MASQYSMSCDPAFLPSLLSSYCQRAVWSCRTHLTGARSPAYRTLRRDSRLRSGLTLPRLCESAWRHTAVRAGMQRYTAKHRAGCSVYRFGEVSTKSCAIGMSAESTVDSSRLREWCQSAKPRYSTRVHTSPTFQGSPVETGPSEHCACLYSTALSSLHERSRRYHSAECHSTQSNKHQHVPSNGPVGSTTNAQRT